MARLNPYALRAPSDERRNVNPLMQHPAAWRAKDSRKLDTVIAGLLVAPAPPPAKGRRESFTTVARCAATRESSAVHRGRPIAALLGAWERSASAIVCISLTYIIYLAQRTKSATQSPSASSTLKRFPGPRPRSLHQSGRLRRSPADCPYRFFVS